MKSCKNLTCYSCIFNVQLLVHLKKWCLKFKPLYLGNYASYFNEICRISCVNTHIKSLKVWLKSIVPWQKYSIFSRGLFLLAHPVEQLVELFNARIRKIVVHFVSEHEKNTPKLIGYHSYMYLPWTTAKRTSVL